MTAIAGLALGGALASSVSGAAAATVFHARVGHALGLIPNPNSEGKYIAQPSEGGIPTPVVYHGGKVMAEAEGVKVHTIFWAPTGFSFQPNYQKSIERYFTDVAAEFEEPSVCSGETERCNIFSTLEQYGEGTGAGHYKIDYEPEVRDEAPYPAKPCTSPVNAKACITDEHLQEQVQEFVETHGNERGLHNLWFVFLPPNVDECISPGECASIAFGGYHSFSGSGGEAIIYAVSINPLLFGGVPPGDDPNGNPDAEAAINTAAHETAEAMTDPEGAGWLDPNGYEVGDKCVYGPQFGTPLGFDEENLSPYNQVINGDRYLTQEIWSNYVNGCVQGATDEELESPSALPEVELTQFSPEVKGNIGSSTPGIRVTVVLERSEANGAPVPVAQGEAFTKAKGEWELILAHPVGDDRDRMVVEYEGIGAPETKRQAILTGNGGDPFTGSGWTGWTALDRGSAIEGEDLFVGPCLQVGVLSYTLEGKESPIESCVGSHDEARAELKQFVEPGELVTVSSNDNRSYAPEDKEFTEFPNPKGGLVKLTVPVGESEAVPASPSPLPSFLATGFPTCTANLGAQEVKCTGLVNGETYKLIDEAEEVQGKADSTGTLITEPESLKVHGGDMVELSNGARTLTTLHVARLKVNIEGTSSTVKSGKCEPDEYWGGPLTSAPVSLYAGLATEIAGGAALTGEICPESRDPEGLPTAEIGQTDEWSGGETVTELANLANTSPSQGETMYGNFTALAEASESPIELSIAKEGSTVKVIENVDRPEGVEVTGLLPGNYTATWTVKDKKGENGDTRTYTTRFIERSGEKGATGSQGATGSEGPAGSQGATGVEGEKGPQGVPGAPGGTGPQGSPGAQGVQGSAGPAGPAGPRGPEGPRGPAGPKPTIACKLTGKSHTKIACTVKFPTAKTVKGTVRLSLARGSRLVALGHAQLQHGLARLTMRELRRTKSGQWTLSLVLARPHERAETITLVISLR